MYIVVLKNTCDQNYATIFNDVRKPTFSLVLSRRAPAVIGYQRSEWRMDERKSEKKKLFPLVVNRARVNYHSSGERDAQKRNARAVARKRTKGIVNGEWEKRVKRERGRRMASGRSR